MYIRCMVVYKERSRLSALAHSLIDGNKVIFKTLLFANAYTVAYYNDKIAQTVK